MLTDAEENWENYDANLPVLSSPIAIRPRDKRTGPYLPSPLRLCQDREGNLWLGNDESTGLSRLKRKTPGVFTKHDYQELSGRLELPEKNEEIDIEKMDIQEDRLWIMGSHTSTRKKHKCSKDAETNLECLSKVRLRPNRFLIAAARIDGGKLEDDKLAQIPITKEGNALSLALWDDPHLSPFLCTEREEQHGGCRQIASKENGFDIEGMAIREDRVFLGLRGPVLRGWAILLEIRLAEDEGNRLTLESIGSGNRLYRKHFVYLQGMGVHELMWYGSDLLILAGPTMDITELQSIYRLRYAADLTDDSTTALDDGRLELLHHLPLVKPMAIKPKVCAGTVTPDSWLSTTLQGRTAWWPRTRSWQTSLPCSTPDADDWVKPLPGFAPLRGCRKSPSPAERSEEAWGERGVEGRRSMPFATPSSIAMA